MHLGRTFIGYDLSGDRVSARFADGSTAVADVTLRRELSAAGSAEVVAAISRYEREMLRYGFAAVRKSLRNAEQAAHSTAPGRAAFRTVLRLTAAIPPLRRNMARDLGNQAVHAPFAPRRDGG
ncbi:hypothetical protein AB0J74_14000 [Asanoa sp. NPDC049573]|uniref:hypothetical protein n=1 Tax=Asanoa sp. NPDC049573 TaxID=3155396 RepID=UPI003417B74E